VGVSALEVVRDRSAVSRFLQELSSAPFLALDTETSGLDPHVDKVLLIQFGTADRQILIDAEAVGPETIREIFEPDRLVVMHNATFDLKMLWQTYGDAAGLAQAYVGDTQIAEQLLRNGRKSDVVMQGYGLKALAERYAGMELDKTIRQGFYGVRSLSELSETELYYAVRDVEATWKVFAQQLPELERDDLMRVLAVEGGAAPAFAQLELSGMPIDADAWGAQVEGAKKQVERFRKELDWELRTVADRDLFGATTLNYDDDTEVLAALGKLGLDLHTVRREALLAVDHPAAAALAGYREHRKLVSTYGDAFLAHRHGTTGRLHPRFKPLGASTGRTACSEPNLQNVPGGSAFRACFRAPAGRRIVTADYATAELRILAEMSEDPVFLEAFHRGDDLHARVARRVFGVEVSKTERPELRERAKVISFGLVYGMSAQGLAHELGLSDADAEDLLESYFRAFPRIRAYLRDTAQAALRRGFAETLTGRRLWFTDMRRDGRDESTLVRLAKNMPIQGTSADMAKLAMGRAVRGFAESGLDAKLVNMVHDELVVEAAEADADRAAEVLRDAMVSAGRSLLRSVPTVVDVEVGEAWSKR
jgi:DNA polymerase-1